MSQATPRRVRLAEAREARIHRPEAAAAYEQARLRYELAEAIRARREELGWSQRQLVAQPGLLVCSSHLRAVDAGFPGLGKADAPRSGLAHRHPSSSSSAVWPSRWQRAIAAAARAISAVSRILVLVNTVSMMIRRPGAIQ